MECGTKKERYAVLALSLEVENYTSVNLISEARIEVLRNLMSNFDEGEHSSISSESIYWIFYEPVLSIEDWALGDQELGERDEGQQDIELGIGDDCGMKD